MQSGFRWILPFLGLSVLALVVIGVGGVVWGALVLANLRTTASIPWCVPALLLVLWGYWRYVGGKGWPAGSQATRRRLLRAKGVSAPAWRWTILAGLLSIGALAGLWIVLVQWFPMPVNALLPARFTSSPLMIGAIILGASILAPITEESMVRGYLQSRLERDLPRVAAVLLSSVVFAIAHISQSIAWPKLLFYFLVGVTFGALAAINDFILPVIPVHMTGDLIFFVFIWLHDAARKFVRNDGADEWFWIHVAQVVVLAACALLAFRKLQTVQQANSASSAKDVTSKSGLSSAARVAP